MNKPNNNTRRFVSVILLMYCVFFSMHVQAAEKQSAGNTCTGDANLWDWDTIWTCVGGAFQRGSLLLGSGSNTCAAADAGRLQWDGTGFEGCNGTNWLGLGTINLGTSATAASPSRSGDASTGLYTSGAATLNIATNGVQRMQIPNSAKLMIGTGTPLSPLDVAGGVSMGTFAGTIAAPANGLITSGALGIGITLFTGPSVDLSGTTSSILLPKGTIAQRPAASFGRLRYSTDGAGTVDISDGSTWTTLLTSQATQTPTVESGTGYFVLTSTTYTGSLGGLTSADASCLTELTTNTGWQDYATANGAGQLVASKVHAFLCDATLCQNLLPLTTYRFENAGDATAGGAGSTFTTDSSGFGPSDSANWSLYFNTVTNYWTGRGTGSATLWPSTVATNTCTGWTSNSGSVTGGTGGPNNTTASRWSNGSVACSGSKPIICMVNP